MQSQERASSTEPPAPRSSFERLRSKIDIERVDGLTVSSVAGHYSSNSHALRKRVVPMGGRDLYLFPDGSYLYLVWTDIPPTTIQDKGQWVVSGSEVTLTSDPEIKWDPGAERHYLLIRRHAHSDEILIVGRVSDVRYFEEHAKDDPEFMLVLISKTRVSKISEKDATELKKQLMREAWRPSFYGSK